MAYKEKETTKVSKWGNSLGIRLPARSAARAGISDETILIVESTEGVMTLKPTRSKKPARASRLSLDTLIANIRPANLNRDDEWLNMPSVGKEIWW